MNYLKWLSPCYSYEEDAQYHHPTRKGWFKRGLLMPLIGCVFFILRRFSFHEHAKRLFLKKTPDEGTPMIFTDAYILIWVVAPFFIAFLVSANVAYWPALTCQWVPELWGFSFQTWNLFPTLWMIFIIIQIIQTNLYHNIWRLVIKRRSPDEEGHDAKGVPLAWCHVRNLFIGLLLYIEINGWFGLIYWRNRLLAFDDSLLGVWHAIYFSFVTGSTLGYGEVSPCVNDESWFVRLIVVFQILACITLLGVIVSQSLNATRGLLDHREHNDLPKTFRVRGFSSD